MGDYIDRGPESFEVVDHLIGLQALHPDIVFLKGNHEQMLEDYLSGQGPHDLPLQRRPADPGQLPEAGGRLRASTRSRREHLRFFESLVLLPRDRGLHFRARRPAPGRALGPARSVEDLLWIREKFIDSPHSFGKRVVFGHTPFEKPLVEPNKIGIDTGAVFGNMLTCVQLPDEIFFQA